MTSTTVETHEWMSRLCNDQEGETMLVDKPIDWTSFDIVNRVRLLFNIRKAGHAGTLDPKASGLLIVCTGKETKSIEQYAALEKEYEGVLVLGAVTPSYDSETPVTATASLDGIGEGRIRDVMTSTVGTMLQQPPMYSAVKVGGKPLYAYARKGRTIERKAREITIASVDVTAVALPAVSFRISCSKGTYIRSLVNDWGAAIGCGAYLRSLRRTRIGTYRVEEALSIEELHRLADGIRTRTN